MWHWFEQQINRKYDCHLAQVSPVDHIYICLALILGTCSNGSDSVCMRNHGLFILLVLNSMLGLGLIELP